MRLPRFSSVVPALVLLVVPHPTFAQLKADMKAGVKLLAEGDALADKGDTTEAVVRYKRTFEQLLPGMRKIPFLNEVKRDVTKREDMSAMLLKEIDEEMTPRRVPRNELGMKALGLLSREFNLKETMVKIYSEEIAAFYDTRTKTMHLIKEPEAKAKKPPSFLERLLGKTEGFDKDENKTVIAHELTHALADQNFDLDAMQKAIKHDDDQDLALSALIEGEATLTMFGAQMQDWTGSVIRDVPSSRLDRLFSMLIPFMPMAGGASLRKAPVILSETMVFPYLRGVVFCSRLTNDSGWQALNDAYRNPPLSTEQIVHPENAAEPDPPTEVDLGKLDPGKGWTEVGRNVVGEMQLAILLRRNGGKTAAAGWDGDRFAVFENPEHRLGLVWLTTWDTEEDAREFARGYGSFQSAKLNDAVPLAPVGESPPPPTFSLRRRGLDVAVVEGFPAAVTESLLDAAFRAKKTEKTHPPVAKPKPEKRS